MCTDRPIFIHRLHRVRAVHLLVCATLVLTACTATTPPISTSATTSRRFGPSENDLKSAFTALPVYDRLEPFATEAEFKAYLHRVADIHDRYHVLQLPARDAPPLLLAQQAAPCDPDVEECEALSEVQVTGSRVTSKQSITNNQVVGVDEGDIVKSWGRFLIILHDARLFSVDLGDTRGQMRLAARVDAYQDSTTDAWYDELLIRGNKVLVTGYSYDAGQTEVSVFDIDARGRLKLTTRFFIQSEDYFSGGNYASRLVDGRLVLYTPIELSDLLQNGSPKFPRIRSWTPKGGFTAWKTLLSATDIYRPIDRALEPVIHAISVCSILSGATPTCASTGIMASGRRELYVSPEAAYLWTSVEMVRDHIWSGWHDCSESDFSGPARPATLYQLPFAQEPVTAVRTHGQPQDQFNLERRATMFHALVRRQPVGCYPQGPAPLEFISFPIREFSDVPAEIGASRVHAMPSVGAGYLSTRFSKDYLTYGAGRGWWRVLWSEGELEDSHAFVTAPLRHPDQPLVHPLVHSIERVELLGDNVVTFGATADRGLGVTTLDLRSTAKLASTLRLPGVLESEGRSHAFNADVLDDGSAVFGLPTAVPTGAKTRWGSAELKDAVHFFTATTALDIDTVGLLPGDQLPDNPTYQCEVSCVDWYGNARPIFYRGRIFALLGREFVEGQIDGGSIREIGRMDLTLPPLQ
jgi:hypothetical protein